MENSFQNVSIFQFIFIDQEIVPFIQAVAQFAGSIQTKLTTFEKERKLTIDSSGSLSPHVKKNFLFNHCFKFDIDHLDNFSNELKTLFIRDFHHFKKVILEISYRIIKGILKKKIRLNSSQGVIEKIIDNILDPCQIRISIEPFNLPFEQSGFRKLDGTISVGHHIFLTGRITNIEQPRHIIIRRLYKCKNPDCKNSFYLHFNDINSNSNAIDSSFLDANSSSVYCDKCNELASEDETGRITASFQKFYIAPVFYTSNAVMINSKSNLFFSDSIINYKYFSFFPQIELKVKDFNRNNNYNCSELLMVGKVIDIIGTSIKHHARIICEPNYTFPLQDSCQMADSKSYFNQFLARIEQYFPGAKYYKSFVRIATAALCAVSSSTQLLFVVKTMEDMKILVHFLVESVLEPGDCDVFLPNEKSLLKSNLKNLSKQQLKSDQRDINYSSQPQPPGLLSRKSVIIYHLESITSRNRDKLKRIIMQKSVSGCNFVSMTLIGILVSKEIDCNEISLFDSFPMIVRIDSFPRKLFINLYFDSIAPANSINLFNQNDDEYKKYDLFTRSQNEENFVLQIRQNFPKVAISEEGQTLIDDFIGYIDRNSNLNENQIEQAINSFGSNDSSMIKFANLGLNISPEIIAMCARAIATIRGDSIASENDVVMSIYFFEERLTALTGAEDNELDQFPPGSESFFCPGISAIPTKDEGVLFGCYCSILNRIISD